MTDNVLAVLERHHRHLLKSIAMMSTGTMVIRVEGKDATRETIDEYTRIAAELEAAIARNGERNA